MEPKEKGSFLKSQFAQMESLIVVKDQIDTSVSSAPVAWHIDHMLKTINVIYDSLESSEPTEYETNVNFIRSVVYLTGIMPRGVAQSPQSVRPPEVILESDIRKQLQEARIKMKAVFDLSEKANFTHPRFEQLDRDQTIRFIEIHTNHHLKIIEDIREKTSPLKNSTISSL